jgi:hypothetical protein
MEELSLESLTKILYENKIYLLDGKNMWIYNGKTIKKVKENKPIVE